ncbi:MAG: 16S rRNA (guanine(966)-N(2))-methyltransferase RsmD [Lachnospiraceae bacterium]|jgi:RNA methyltransferase, RsmD family|nr:16S rRNA (guanine(966)-N(2))-methyltransferase RsmD [Lachnospiraceae bacterium]
MRVIAGKARSLKLMTPPGMDTRPTTDRTKETLFNILQPEIGGARFLDLFSGSGAIGIEALSRGAAFAVFVEKDRAAAECIRKNLAFTKLGDNGQILRKDVGAALKSLEKGEPFDLIFMDPPYGRGLERQVLEYLAHSSLLAEEGTVVVEASLETTFDHVQDLGFQVIKIKKYKTNMHVWIVKGEEDVESSVSGEL